MMTHSIFSPFIEDSEAQCSRLDRVAEKASKAERDDNGRSLRGSEGDDDGPKTVRGPKGRAADRGN